MFSQIPVILSTVVCMSGSRSLLGWAGYPGGITEGMGGECTRGGYHRVGKG